MNFPLPLGTLVNVASVLIGGSIGLLLHKKFPDKIKKIIFQAVGLFTIGLGILMVLEMTDGLIIVFSLVIGGVIGEWLALDERLESTVLKLKQKLQSGHDDKQFTVGLTTAFLIFCVGSMTIVGAIDEGLRNNHSLLMIKSLMDGMVAITLASSYGVGVLFCVIPLFIYQVALTLLAWLFQGIFTDTLIAQMTALGGLLILGLGFNLLDIKKIKVTNLLPSLIVIVLLTLFINYLKAHIGFLA